MGSREHALFRARACDGELVVFGRDAAASELALATSLAELENTGATPRTPRTPRTVGTVGTVILRLTRRSDDAWAIPALRWLDAHGRRPLLRTAATLSRPLIDAAWEHRATVLLEVAHHQAPLQRALIGPDAEPSASLLLQAQHLGQRGIGVAAHLGPLLPGLHDRRQQVEPLLRHLRAASIRDLHLSVGRLTPGRLAALDRAADAATALAIRRSFGVSAGDRGDAWRGGARQLPTLSAAALREGIRRLVGEHGLRIDACGCGGFCHLDGGGRPEYVAVAALPLFGSDSSGASGDGLVEAG